MKKYFGIDLSFYKSIKELENFFSASEQNAKKNKINKDLFIDDRWKLKIYENDEKNLVKLWEAWVGNGQILNEDRYKLYKNFLKKNSFNSFWFVEENRIFREFFYKPISIENEVLNSSCFIADIMSKYYSSSNDKFRIFEIGGGFGLLAGLFYYKYKSNINYWLIDAYSYSLAGQVSYLKKKFGETKVKKFEDFHSLNEALNFDGFVVCASWNLDKLNLSNNFDLCVAISSIQETSIDTQVFYIELINKILKTEGNFISLNDFFFPKTNYGLINKNFKINLLEHSPRSRTFSQPLLVCKTSHNSMDYPNLYGIYGFIKKIDNLITKEKILSMSHKQKLDLLLKIKKKLIFQRKIFFITSVILFILTLYLLI